MIEHYGALLKPDLLQELKTQHELDRERTTAQVVAPPKLSVYKKGLPGGVAAMASLEMLPRQCPSLTATPISAKNTRAPHPGPCRPPLPRRGHSYRLCRKRGAALAMQSCDGDTQTLS